MNQVVNEVSQVVNEVAPDSVAAEAVTAIASTVASPENPITLIQDVELAIKLAKRLKASLAGMHPSITDFIKALF